MIDHHIEDEEKELFKAAKKVLSKEDERGIGRLFIEEKLSMSKMAPPTVM
jgi:hemerythrin-like domain-containing protein